MKKIILCILFLVVSATLFAQIEKPTTTGKRLIGGIAYTEYYSYKTNSDTTNNLSASLSPSIGYFIFDGLVFGVSNIKE
jgi:hypothetical protein